MEMVAKEEDQAGKCGNNGFPQHVIPFIVLCKAAVEMAKEQVCVDKWDSGQRLDESLALDVVRRTAGSPGPPH